MIFIFDLDSTLLNTKKLRENIAAALGISVNKFESSSSQIFDSQDRNYSLLEHIEYLRHNGIIKNSEIIPTKLQKVIRRMDDFLFSDTRPLLKLIKNAKYKLILVTFGNKEWQQTKLNSLYITKYFSRVIVTDNDKRKELEFLKGLNKGKIYIINDKASEALALREFFGEQAKVFLVKSHRSHDVEHDLEIYNLKDVRKIIENEITQTANR